MPDSPVYSFPLIGVGTWPAKKDEIYNEFVIDVETTLQTLQPLDSDLTAYAALATTGLVARTGAGTVATRTITGTANKVTVTNGDGVSGNPTLTLPAIIAQEGIAFPATQVPSADANTLDDYEEGTWTPELTFATPGDLSVTYSTQDGTYTKVGNLVYIKAFVTTSSFTYTTASGQFRVSGIPYAPDAGFHHVTNSMYLSAGIIAGAGKIPVALVVPSYLAFYTNDPSTGGAANLSTSSVASGTNKSFRISAVYRTS